MHVNDPPKSGPSTCKGATSFTVLSFGCLAVKSIALSDRDKDLSRYRSVSLSVCEQRVDRIVGPYWFTDTALYKASGRQIHPNTSQFFASAHNCVVPTADVHLRPGEQISGTRRLRDLASGEGE